MGDFFKFCGLFRLYEVYQNWLLSKNLKNNIYQKGSPWKFAPPTRIILIKNPPQVVDSNPWPIVLLQTSVSNNFKNSYNLSDSKKDTPFNMAHDKVLTTTAWTAHGCSSKYFLQYVPKLPTVLPAFLEF